jgi:hypothetical protein
MSEVPAFARSAMGGKRTARIEARVTDETKFALAQRCHQIGITESDYITNLVELSLFGYDHVASVQQDRLRMVCGGAGLIPSHSGGV